MTHYARTLAEENCGHSPEAHVVYDVDGYRAQLRCPCSKLSIPSRRVRKQYAEAEADALAMVQLAHAHSAVVRKELRQ